MPSSWRAAIPFHTHTRKRQRVSEVQDLAKQADNKLKNASVSLATEDLTNGETEITVKIRVPDARGLSCQDIWNLAELERQVKSMTSHHQEYKLNMVEVYQTLKMIDSLTAKKPAEQNFPSQRALVQIAPHQSFPFELEPAQVVPRRSFALQMASTQTASAPIKSEGPTDGTSANLAIVLD